MQRFLIAASAAVVILSTACSNDTSAPSTDMSLSMASAYTNVPAGFSELNSSFIGDEGMAFQPVFSRGGLSGHGFRGPGFGLGLGFMGGGLFRAFLGEGFGRASFF